MSKVAITGKAAGTGVFTVASPNSNVDRVLTLPDETGTVITTATTLVPSTTNTSITLGTAVATTSGTSIDFTGIPAGVKRVMINIAEVSVSGTAGILIQIGGSGGIETSGYHSLEVYIGPGTSGSQTTIGFSGQTGNAASESRSGVVILSLLNAATNFWTASGMTGATSDYMRTFAGRKALATQLNRVRIATFNGTDTFDLGSVNISWEF